MIAFTKRTGWIAVVTVVLLLGWGMVTPAPGQQPNNSKSKTQKIAFISVQTIEDQWLEYQVLRNDLDKLFKIDKKDIRDLRADLLKRNKTLEDSLAQGIVSQREFETRQRQLIAEAQEIAIYAKMRARLVQSKVDEKMDRATEYVQQAINEIGKQEGYDFILNEENVLGLDRRLDISHKVIETLNGKTYGI